MSVPTRRIIEPVFGKPVLVAANNGIVSWTKNTSLSQFQKDTGWQAELYGGVQSGDDWAACYIPVQELYVTQFESAQWSWYQTATETMGLSIVIWIHDPNDFDKRAEVTQLANVAGLDKAAGWNSHEFNTATDQMFFYGENTTGTGLTAGTLYSWDDFQADVLFKNWVIYRVSLDWGWEASGTFEASYLAEVKLNGSYIPIRPDETEIDQAYKSSGVFTSDTGVKATPGRVEWITVSGAGTVQINDSVADGGTDVWSITLGSGGYIHAILKIDCATGIFIDVPSGAPGIVVGYL